MDDVVGRMEVVAGVVDADAAADPVLTLADGTRCTLPRGDRRFPVWRRIVEAARDSGVPVYVESAPAGSAAALLPVGVRRIARVGRQPQGDRVPVAVAGSPAPHFLSTARPGFPGLQALLRDAAGTRDPLLLAVQPGTLEIVDARRPPQGLRLVVF